MSNNVDNPSKLDTKGLFARFEAQWRASEEFLDFQLTYGHSELDTEQPSWSWASAVARAC